jgi:hypothetical protein
VADDGGLKGWLQTWTGLVVAIGGLIGAVAALITAVSLWLAPKPVETTKVAVEPAKVDEPGCPSSTRPPDS